MNLLEMVDTQCPYCGETINLMIDCSQAEQYYIEDCYVCCCPINLSISVDENQLPVVSAKHEDEV
jgi:hypothetical protein